MIPANLNIKKIIIIASVAIVVLTCIILWATHSVFRFSISGADEYVLEKNNDGTTSSVFTVFGFSLIPKSTEFVEVKDGDKQTRHTLTTMPWFGIQDEAIAIENQRAVSKVGQNSPGCDIRSESAGATYSYNCLEPSSPVIQFGDKSEGDYDNTTSYTMDVAFNIDREPYLNGTLALSVPESQALEIEYRNLEGDITASREFGSIDSADRTFQLFTEANTEKFILVDSDEGIFYFFNDGVNGDYTEASQDDITGTDDEVFLSDCTFNSTDSYCFFSLTDTHDGDESESEQEDGTTSNHGDTPTAGIMSTIDNSSNHTATEVSYGFDKMCLTDSAIIATNSNGTLYYTATSALDDQHILDMNVRTLNCDGATIAYAKDSEVYYIQNTSAHLLFSLDRFSISNVTTQSNGVILFNAFLNPENPTVESDQVLHSYAIDLSSEIDDVAARIEHTLPYNLTGLPMFENDYDDTNVYIKPQISATSDHATGELIIDQDELDAVKSQIEARLESDGIIGQRDIVYY